MIDRDPQPKTTVSRWITASELKRGGVRYNAKEIEAIEIMKHGSKKTGRGCMPNGFRNGAKVSRH